MQQIKTFLMFTGQAEEAMNFYISLFKNSKVLSISRYEKGQPGAEGSVKRASFSLNGQELMCIDSPPVHAFTFMPSMSLFVTCADEAEIDELFKQLSDGGQVLMPLNKYPFSDKYAWVTDKFGVAWQLSL